MRPGAGDQQLDDGITALLARLDGHARLVDVDAGRAGDPLTAPVNPVPEVGKVSRIVADIEKISHNPRESLVEHLKRYKDKPDWRLADSKARLDPRVLAHLYKFGRSAKIEVQEYIQKKELETCHAAQELILLAVILDRIVGEKFDMNNCDSVEVM